MASDWGSDWLLIGACGHINAESGLGDWDEGLALLHSISQPLGDAT
jgi:predicted alpha/beta hydrolase family esterase